MKNTIALRILDFLKNYPPFYFLSKDEIFSLAKEIQVSYYSNSEAIYHVNDLVHQNFYIVKDGAISITNYQNTLSDVCDEGDIFGFIDIDKNNQYLNNAIAKEESIIYSIPIKLFTKIINNNKKAKDFISSYLIDIDNDTNFINDFNISQTQQTPFTKNPITIAADTIIKDAAILMSKHQIGSLIIIKDSKPLGIITDKDLRNKIATGIFSINEPVSKIMSSPVITYKTNISITEAQIAMLKHQISHLCLTIDGTDKSDLMGIVSEHDVLVNHSNHPSLLIKEIKKVEDEFVLKEIRKKAEKLISNYLSNDISIHFINTVISEINKAITKKIIDLSIDELPTKPKVKFAWLAIGSQGRDEQLLLSDQDNALVFDACENNDLNKKYFLQLAEKVNHKLTIVGFEKCPAAMMASNPKWCLNIIDWQTQFKNWISQPTEEKILLCNIFFDFQLIYGDTTLIEKLSQTIIESVKTNDLFLNYLARNALQNPPPLSFFRNFLVEDSGEHQNEFDIKLRAIMPLVDAARVLCLSHHIKNTQNTILRFKKLAEVEPQNKLIYEACINAYQILLIFRTKNGLANHNSGRFIKIEDLDKTDRLKLKSCFKPIKDVQELLITRFKLSYIL